MEKVMLTKEQAHEFESFKALRSSLEEWARDKYDPNAAHSIIHELTFDQAARAFLIGYEVEPEQPKFQPGDKVVRIDGNAFAGFKNIETVEEVDSRGSYRMENQLVYTWDFIRHATPEEIYWLETLGREKVREFREGDVFAGIDTSFFILNEIDIEDARIWYKDGMLRGLYPAESFKPFPQEESK